MSGDLKVSAWDSSYSRRENHLFFPKEELVKFLSRHVRRRLSFSEFQTVADLPQNPKALDYGCGLGRQSLLLGEFGFDVTGVDISAVAIAKAEKLRQEMDIANVGFSVASGTSLDFPDNSFSVSISDCVLDSMTFDNARQCIQEIDRVTNGFFYFNLISGENLNRDASHFEESVVDSDFEHGTMQTYYNWQKITELLEGTSLELVQAYSVTEEDVFDKAKLYKRFHMVTKSKKS